MFCVIDPEKTDSLESMSSNNARRLASSSTEEEDSRHLDSPSNHMLGSPLGGTPDSVSPAKYSIKLKRHFKSMIGKTSFCVHDS